MPKRKRKICVVSGSRADYGYLYWLLQSLKDDVGTELQLVATGMHLCREFGSTYKDIEADGFALSAKVDMMLAGDSAECTAKSIGVGVIGFADVFARLQPEIVVLFGDRFEIFAAAQAALVAKIPLAHIAGGDTTEGAYDEALRHSITKMSHLHFVTNDIAAKRVRQMGEDPDHIFVVGSPGLDYIRHIQTLPRGKLEDTLQFKFRKKNVLVTFHPATLDAESAPKQFQHVLDALQAFGRDLGIIFTFPNADTHGRTLIDMIEQYVAIHDNAKSYPSLGQKLYMSVITQVDAVVGNSSSGLYEAPSFKKPTVNIGDRQKGRLQAASVINCAPAKESIMAAIKCAFDLDCSDVVNPYGSGDSSAKIASKLKAIDNLESLLKKKFHLLES